MSMPAPTPASAGPQALQDLLALFNSRSNKTHLTQQLAAVVGAAAPNTATAEQRVRTATGGAAAAAAIASVIRSAAAGMPNVSGPVPGGKKASALDIQNLYQNLQAPHGTAAGSAAPAPNMAPKGALLSPKKDVNPLSLLGHRRVSGSTLMGACILAFKYPFIVLCWYMYMPLDFMSSCVQISSCFSSIT
jgi:hypothetical protein